MSESKSKSNSQSKSLYPLKNWSEYDASLKQRGSITFWLTPEVVQEWLNKTKTGPRRPFTVSRQLQKLNILLPAIPTNEAIHVVVDSTNCI